MASFTLSEAMTRALAPTKVAGTAGWPRPPARSGASHRTGAPVQRDSVEAGTFEHLFFAVPVKGEPDRLVRLARAALDAGRRVKRAARMEARALTRDEQALARLSAGAVRVYEELCMLARLNAGRVYPSYDRLAAATALGRATIARAIAALEGAGFLVRQRRFKRVDGDGAGPRYAQTSNAYRPTAPTQIEQFLPRWLQPAPVPDDMIQHAADHADEHRTMLAGLSCRELAQATVGGALGRALARLGAGIDRMTTVSGDSERESHDGPEPLTHFNLSRDKQTWPGRPRRT